MRAALIYGEDDKKLELFAKKLFSAIERKGNKLKIIKVEKGITAGNLLPYEFIFVGCSVSSLFKGKLPSELTDYIKRCNGLERKKDHCFYYSAVNGQWKNLKEFNEFIGEQRFFYNRL
ncbi:MAG TPA: hypothetical protein ENI51_01395 [Candidatus Atribacteria bacterium]|nr:hypothetical protein [Candidatus Atribacteria bacterium]